MLKLFILDEHGDPTPADSVLAWGEWMQRNDRLLQRTMLADDVRIQTDFIGCFYAWETMIFGGGYNHRSWRYNTRKEALAGHEHAVLVARGEEADED